MEQELPSSCSINTHKHHAVCLAPSELLLHTSMPAVVLPHPCRVGAVTKSQCKALGMRFRSSAVCFTFCISGN